ncbi:MAG TPA: hypothetical protein VFY69_10195 [Solirubrobacterales bacterium]|nr:hypothetical protein [Solirubrobacterales bacterium]
MKLRALSQDASRLEAVTWWRDWMALLTTGSFVVLLILLVLGSADWILIIVFAAAVYCLRQVVDLTQKARKLSQQG